MANGILVKYVRYFLEDISYKIKHWKSSFPIEVNNRIKIKFKIEFFVLSASVMFAFPDRQIVKKVVNYLPRVGVGGRYGLPQQR
jgi:hypothetical protein